MASSLHSHINGYKENIRFEVKPFNLLSIHSKNQLEGSLNFERAPIKLQTTLKSNGQPRNFKICGQVEAHWGSPQGEVDLAI
jgi:hypothetical protein